MPLVICTSNESLFAFELPYVYFNLFGFNLQLFVFCQ